MSTTTDCRQPASPQPEMRRHPAADDDLRLTELDPASVLDLPSPGDAPFELITFGSVREHCPRCALPSLKLVLRQQLVRKAHLHCPQCGGCFDAHYHNGTSALTI